MQTRPSSPTPQGQPTGAACGIGKRRRRRLQKVPAVMGQARTRAVWF